jgi:hypothetical protein
VGAAAERQPARLLTVGHCALRGLCSNVSMALQPE